MAAEELTHIDEMVLAAWRVIQWDEQVASEVLDEIPIPEGQPIKDRIVDLWPHLSDEEKSEAYWLARYDSGERGNRAAND